MLLRGAHRPAWPRLPPTRSESTWWFLTMRAARLGCRLLKGCASGVFPFAWRKSHNSRSGGRMGRFESTAPWYARFRPRYPPELIERLVTAAGLDGSSRVLDLGTGPGHVASAIARHVGEVVAVDIEAGMLAQIEEPNVRTVVGPAEDVDASWG